MNDDKEIERNNFWFFKRLGWMVRKRWRTVNSLFATGDGWAQRFSNGWDVDLEMPAGCPRQKFIGWYAHRFRVGLVEFAFMRFTGSGCSNGVSCSSCFWSLVGQRGSIFTNTLLETREAPQNSQRTSLNKGWGKAARWVLCNFSNALWVMKWILLLIAHARDRWKHRP